MQEQWAPNLSLQICRFGEVLSMRVFKIKTPITAIQSNTFKNLPLYYIAYTDLGLHWFRTTSIKTLEKTVILGKVKGKRREVKQQ